MLTAISDHNFLQIHRPRGDCYDGLGDIRLKLKFSDGMGSGNVLPTMYTPA